MTNQVCATPGCGNPVAARQGSTGRPPTYCSASCRLALRVKRRQPKPEHTTTPTAVTTTTNEIAVEIRQDPDNPTPMRSWTVTIHRGQQTVTVGHDLGRFAATALTSDLQQLFNPNTRQDKKRAID